MCNQLKQNTFAIGFCRTRICLAGPLFRHQVGRNVQSNQAKDICRPILQIGLMLHVDRLIGQMCKGTDRLII